MKLIIDRLLITTTENIPGAEYSIIGFVGGLSDNNPFAKDALNTGYVRMQEEAAKLGADAIVAVKCEIKGDFAYFYGTAVRYKAIRKIK